MMMEVTAGNFKVVVMRIAMAAPAPKPGKTPVKVPNRTPMKQKRRLYESRAIEKPYQSWSNTFMSICSPLGWNKLLSGLYENRHNYLIIFILRCARNHGHGGYSEINLLFR